MSDRGATADSGFLGEVDSDVALECFQVLASTVDEGIFQLDADGRFVAVNDAFVRFTGYDRERLRGEHIATVVDDGDIERFERAIQRQLEADNGAVEPFEFTVETAPGDRVPCAVQIHRLREGDDFRGTVGVLLDTVGRKERAPPAHPERELLDRIFESSPVGIIALTPDGEILTLNDRAAEIVGTDPDRVSGARDRGPEWNVYDANGDPIPPEERTFARVLRTGEPVTDVEMQIERADGDRIWVSVNGVPVDDSMGDLSLVILSYEDISELKDRERQLLQEHVQTEKLLQTAPIALSVQDAEGNTLLANRRAQDLLGLSERDFIEQPSATDGWRVYDADGELLDPDAYPSARVLRSGESILDEELLIDPPTGDPIWVSVNVAPVFGPDGTIERIISAGEDITERKERERQITRRRDELETELGEILGRISDAFYALDEEWRFTHLNEYAEEVLQYAEEALLGRSVWEVFPDATDGVFWERFHTAMDTQEPVTFEFHAEALEAWLEFNAYPSKTGLSIYFRDVTERKARERELERYETIVETVNDGIYIVDSDGRFTMANETYAEMTGYSLEELIGSHVSLVIDDEVAETARNREHELIAGDRETVVLEAALRTADGGTIPAEATFALLPAGDGTGYERVCVVRDITERKRAERNLRKSEERFRTMMEKSPFSMQVFDAEGRTIAVNPAWERLWDAPRKELDDYNILEDEQLEAAGLFPHLRKAFAGEVVTLPITHYDPAEIGKPGRDRWIEGYVYPLLQGEGERFEVALVHHDITDRKRAEEAMRESEERLRLALEVGELGAWEIDLQTRDSPVHSPQHDRIFGYEEPLDDWSVDSFLDHVHPDDRERVERSFEQAHRTGDWGFQCRIVRADGERRWIAAQGDFSNGGDDDPTRAVGIVQDITDRKRRQQELERTVAMLERSNAELERFAYAASHDLQEPLRMVSSYLQLLEERYREELDSDAGEFIDYAVEGADRMRKMIDALLTYTRLNTLDGDFSPVDCDDVLAQATDNLRVAIEESGAEIVTDPLPTVPGDHNQLIQLFQNLIDNAITYVDDDPPRIRIATERTEDGWLFSVRDNGIGIDPARTDDIFQVFNRLHTRDEYDGTGIGLALCQRIIDRHNGRIWVESDPGEGSTFYFTIPRNRSASDE